MSQSGPWQAEGPSGEGGGIFTSCTGVDTEAGQLLHVAPEGLGLPAGSAVQHWLVTRADWSSFTYVTIPPGRVRALSPARRAHPKRRRDGVRKRRGDPGVKLLKAVLRYRRGWR